MSATAIESARILVVEDEALIADEIRERLVRGGYRVIGTEVAAEAAVSAAQELRPDLVLMDIRLRGEPDGIWAAESIMSRLSVPVVYLTAHSDRMTLERAKASCPFGFVVKPFQERDLVIAVEMALERHRADRLLRASEARWSTTLRSIGDGVIATDVDRQVTFMNPAAERLTGWSFAEASGEPVHHVVRLAAEPGTATPHPMDRAIQERQVVQLEGGQALIDHEGREVPIEDSAAPIVDTTGEVVGAVMAFRDCSARLESERALSQARSDLEKAARMEAMGRFAGGVAHDFNNMLTVVLGNCELLRGLLPEDGEEGVLLREILAAGRRAAAMTGQLLTLGRGQVVEPHPVDLNEVVRGVAPILRRVAGDEVDLRFDLVRAPLPVLLDPGQFEQVLVNLISNARHAMPYGGRARVRTTVRHEDAGELLVLEVTDFGVGMPEEVRGRLFEPFFTTRTGQGVGLGLATVYGAVHQAGGTIEVDSDVGLGSTFRLVLPSGDRAAEAVPAGRVVAWPTSERGTESVLLVDDDVGVRRILARGLADLGYDVREAGDVEEADRYLAHSDSAFHILVSDVVLPGGGASRLARSARLRSPDLKVLFISGFADDRELRELVDSGEAAFLRKPCTPRDVALRMRELLDDDAVARADDGGVPEGTNE